MDRSADIHREWIVNGNVDHIRLGRHDHDVALYLRNHVLRRRAQRAARARLRAAPLDRGHYIGRLPCKRLSQLLGPRELLIEPRDDGRVARKQLDGIDPRLRLQLSLRAQLPFQEAGRKHQIRRLRRRRQDQRHQGVRVKRERRDQRVQLGGGECRLDELPGHRRRR
jgi:hypothetical protein